MSRNTVNWRTNSSDFADREEGGNPKIMWTSYMEAPTHVQTQDSCNPGQPLLAKLMRCIKLRIVYFFLSVVVSLQIRCTTPQKSPILRHLISSAYWPYVICSVSLTAGGLLVVKLPVLVALEEVRLLRVGPRDGGVDVVGQTLATKI